MTNDQAESVVGDAGEAGAVLVLAIASVIIGLAVYIPAGLRLLGM